MKFETVLLADKIKQLIDVSLILIEYCKKLKQLDSKYVELKQSVIERQEFKASEIPTILRFLHCTFFFDALSNLNTSLEPFQKEPCKKEISFFELIEVENDKMRKETIVRDIKYLREQLKNRKLTHLRNKYVAPIDLFVFGHPDVMYLNFIKDEYIESTKLILKKLNNLIQTYYYVPDNN